MLAEEVGVSTPTVSRCITALRRRGHGIRAEKQESGWRYVVVEKQTLGKNRQQAANLSDHHD
jgi:biotin operon repressor